MRRDTATPQNLVSALMKHLIPTDDLHDLAISRRERLINPVLS
jgi:hypothetical protein